MSNRAAKLRSFSNAHFRVTEHFARWLWWWWSAPRCDRHGWVPPVWRALIRDCAVASETCCRYSSTRVFAGVGWRGNRPPGLRWEASGTLRLVEISIKSFGRDVVAGRQLAALTRAWDEAGRPGTEGLQLAAYPIEASDDPGPAEFVIDKRWPRRVLSW